METSKTIRRMLPCPYYDVEGVESWLTDMAAEGLFLEKKGITWGIASFRRGEPRALPYRFVPNVGEPTTERVLLFDDRRGMWPETEERAMNALYGWDYVTRWKRFSIYRASEEGVRELDTDPRIQDIAVGAVQKWEILYFILLPLLLVIVPYLWTSWERLQLSFYSDPILFAISLCIEGWIVFASLARIIFLERLRKKLRQGHPLEHNKPWQQTAAVTKVIRTAGLVVLAVWITACVTSPVGLFGFRQLPYVEEYEGTPPVPVLTELVPGELERIQRQWSFNNDNNYYDRSNVFYPVHILWRELGTVTNADGRDVYCFLYLDYYEARTEKLAEETARLWIRGDIEILGEDYQAIDLPNTGADMQAAYYRDSRPWVVFQKGNKVVYASLFQDGTCPVPIQDWAMKLAEAVTVPV